MDKEKVIKGLKVRIISDTDKGYNTIEIPVNEAENILALLKWQEDALEQMRLDNTDLRNCYAELMKEQEAKTGKWIPIESTTGVEAFGVKEMTVIDVRCSVCGSEEDVSFTGYKYCPRCGAKMTDRR